MIDNLINIEMAGKILLGAQECSKEINPLDYCMHAMNINLEVLEPASAEYQTLMTYIRNTAENEAQIRDLRGIFRLERKGEEERFEQHRDKENRFLMFHGSKISNFMGILSQGLRIAPPEAPKTGYMFGKGIYLADMFKKSA